MTSLHASIALVIVGLARAASADGELGASAEAGAGTDTSAPSGYSTATVDLGVGISRLVPVTERVLCFPDAACYARSGAPDDRDFLRAHADATVDARGDGTRAWFGDAGVAGRLGGWQLGWDLALQPVGRFDDVLWRSGRGVVRNRFSFAMPGLISIPTDHGHVDIMPVDLAVTAWTSPTTYDTDQDIDADTVRVVTPRTTVDVLAVHDSEHDRVFAPTAETGLRAEDFSIDVVRVGVALADSITAHASAGFEGLNPLVAVSYATDGDLTPAQDIVSTPRYAASIDIGPADGAKASLGLASWARIDPSGYAVDTGQLATAAAAWRHGRVDVNLTLEGGRLLRREVSELLPVGVAPAGTVMWMGRSELEAVVDLPHSLSLVGSTWVERSDRDDPRWLVASPLGEIATHAGAGVTARWKLKRPRS